MFIPLALGTLIALLIAPRRLFWHILSMAFVSSAIAVAAQQYYWIFMPAWIAVVALKAISMEKPGVMSVFLLLLAGVLVWLSDNTIISQILVAFSSVLAYAFAGIFSAVGAALGFSGAAGGAVGAALAWTYLARRLERTAEDMPFAILAEIFLGWLVINATISAVGAASEQYSQLTALAWQALSAAISFIAIYRTYEALKGDVEAAVDAAIGAPFLVSAFPALWGALVPIMSVFAVLDIAFSIVQKRYAVSAIALSFALAYVH